MDLRKILAEKSKRFPDGKIRPGIDAVIIHIERAEKYWLKAQSEEDDGLFTDVIYRTNQAFEGALKEAYSVLTGKDSSKLTPNQIEKHLEGNKLLNGRVLAAFTNYRTEWRNKSVHDYKLFFSEQESLLAITSVSAFCVILVDQMLMKASEEYEKDRAKEFSSAIINSIKDYSRLSLERKVASILVASYENLSLPTDRRILESEYIGLLTGFISAVDSNLAVQSEVLINKETRARADLVISLDNEKVLVEVKKSNHFKQYSNEADNEIFSLLSDSGTNHGILMLVDPHAKKGTFVTKPSLFDFGPSVTYVRPEKNA